MWARINSSPCRGREGAVRIDIDKCVCMYVCVYVCVCVCVCSVDKVVNGTPHMDIYNLHTSLTR